jgi:hypothetical protein
MRYDDGDEREAYRRGARDCFESLVNELGVRRARQIEAWLKELDGWEHSEPPPPPLC